jgi:hypothetical protein
MRRVIFPLIALSIAAAPVAVEAQTPGAQQEQRGPGIMNAAERVLQHRDALGLTAEQVSRLQQVQAQFAAQNQPLIERVRAARPAGAQRERRQLTDGQRAETRQRMERRMEQLTPEQREAMRQRREQLRNATPEQRQQMREEMRQRAEQLTPEQRQQLRQRADSTRAERMRQRAVTPEQRAQMEALRPVMEELRRNQQQTREQVHAILTAEQQARLRELNVKRRSDLREGRRGPRQGTRR